MKTVKQIALPLAAGLLFAVSAYWMFANWLSSILYSMFIIPSYLLMIAALLRRRRDGCFSSTTILPSTSRRTPGLRSPSGRWWLWPIWRARCSCC